MAAVSALILATPAPGSVAAATKETYSQIFQNPTTTLDGRAVQTDLYFSKEDYWKVKKATLSLNFQISQLSNRQTSDITIALNGVKFLSFRPSKASGMQIKQINLPLNLLAGTNRLTISGQVINDKAATLPQTPANWLTIYAGSNVNFEYELQEAEPTVKSFYAHFTGMDTIANHRVAVVVPQEATDGELTAAAYALGGIARLITTTDTMLPLRELGAEELKTADYQLIVARTDRLPDNLRAQVTVPQDGALLHAFTAGKRHYLLVTAPSNALLKRAAQFVANQELMSETAKATKVVTANTQVFTSVLQYQGHYQLAQQDTTVSGVGHHSATFFVALPTDRTNTEGSQVRLHLNYAKNLDFKQALATVTVNGKKIGSHALRAARADSDSFVIKLPPDQALGNTFTVGVDLDLALSGTTTNSQTPWATIHSDSYADIRSATHKELLFSNFPSTFIKNESYDNLIMVRPTTMTAADYATLTNLTNLFGNYAKSNTGKLRVTKTKPNALKQASVVAFGTPRENEFIDQLNPQLYFKFTSDKNGFLSNEKLSIEQDWGKSIGTAQLLRSPDNEQKALLVVTGGTPAAATLASTQLATQAAISQYAGDAIVVDADNVHYSYRFKKVAAVKKKVSVKRKIAKNAKIIAYLGVVFLAMVVVVIAVILVLHKHKGEGEQA